MHGPRGTLASEKRFDEAEFLCPQRDERKGPHIHNFTMGAKLSTPLADVSCEELATKLVGLGSKYEVYADAVRENAVDGELLDGFDETEFAETLDDLQVHSRLHRRVLTKEWQSLKQLKDRLHQKKEEQHQQSQHHASLVSGEGSVHQTAAPREFHKFRQALYEDPKQWIQNDDDVEKIYPSNDKAKTLFAIVASYDIDEDTDTSELECFDLMADKIFKESDDILYCGVSFLDPDGHMSLGNRFYLGGDRTSQPLTQQIHIPKEQSQCYRAILGSDKDLVIRELETGSMPALSVEFSGTYFGSVVRSREGERIGTVCAVVDATPEEFNQRNQELLREVAIEAEKALELRRVLVERNKKLLGRIQAAKTHSSDVVLPGFGPVKAITHGDLERRGRSVFPSPEEIARTGKPARTAALPIFQNKSHARPDEMEHLPDDYWEVIDQLGADRTPIHKGDMERVAFVEEVDLKSVDADDPLGVSLARLAELAASLFEVGLVEFSILEHKNNYGLANFHNDKVLTPGQKEFLVGLKPKVKEYPDGKPWLICCGRGPAFCNYVAYTGQTMTAHDVWADESLNWVKKLGEHAFKFYSSSPIWVQNKVIASLCIYDFLRARPDFSRAHEMQLESIAELASQHIQNWMLRKEATRLEDERRRVSMGRRIREIQTLAPEERAAIVFTDVQGSTSLWESNADAMQEALRLHDSIMRDRLEDIGGYEINTEGDAFHMAFHDCYDAVRFALGVQVNLFEADWSDAILSLPDACVDEKNCFRGLRVRMAIHYGDVQSRNNEVSGHREYTGPTVNIAKSLEHMSHGGQILVTSEVWSVMSNFPASDMGSPQAIDLGTHVLLHGKKKNEGVVAKGVVQVLPSVLAYDYSSTNGNENSETKGRRFPPLLSMKQMGASFHDAPCTNNTATLAFVDASEVEKLFDDSSRIIAALAKQVGALLSSADRPSAGYQCKNFMLAFSTDSEAVSFGLDLQEYLNNNLVMGASLTGLVKVGLHNGPFSSMVPCPHTGRADYFGKVVNRAARVAGAAKSGEVWLGLVSEEVPELEDGFVSSFVGNQMLRGVQEEMALYVCRRLPPVHEPSATNFGESISST